jgi:hypothetical protein
MYWTATVEWWTRGVVWVFQRSFVSPDAAEAYMRARSAEFKAGPETVQ